MQMAKPQKTMFSSKNSKNILANPKKPMFSSKTTKTF